jgi:intracellular septation protein
MNSKPFFLLSFLPALAYWVLESYFSLETALIGGILLGVIEMLIEKRWSGHVHTLSKLNLSLVVVLGGVSLIAREGIFFKLQPTFTGLAMASFLVFKKIRQQSLMVEMLRDMNQKLPLPEAFYKILEWHMCLFLIGFSTFMAFVALRESTATWLFWKTAGFYIAFGGFMILELLYLRFFVKGSVK